MFENLPIFGINVKIWVFLGYIRQQNRHSFILCAIVPFINNIFQFIHLYHIWGNFEVLVLDMFMTTIIFNSFMRMFAVARKKQKFVSFMQDIEDWHLEAERQNDRHALYIFKKATKRAQFISNFSFTFATLGLIMTLSFPILAHQRAHPFGVWIPGLDVFASPLYEIVYLIEVFVVMPFIMSSYVPFTNLFVSWLLFGIATLKDLRFKLESLTELNFGNEDKLLLGLKKCIEYHKRIIVFKSTLEDLVSFASFVEFLLFSVKLCVLLFYILVIKTPVLKCLAAIYILSIFYVILLTYWHANEFSYESQRIAVAAYNMEWIVGNKELKKCICILIARSQNPLTIYAGGMYPMNLETFQAVLNASYSYLTLLQGFSAKD